jgi:hypothetical protein
MPTLRDALKFDAHLGAVAEHGGYVLTAVKDRGTGYRLSVAVEGKRPMQSATTGRLSGWRRRWHAGRSWASGQ